MKSTTPSSSSQRTDAFDVLLQIARDLTASLAATDRYSRLLAAVRRIIPYDAACLLRLQGDDLVLLGAHGLISEALEKRFPRSQHPRLEAILKEALPVRFPPDSLLPDPFDGLLTVDPQALTRIHACLGCRLTAGSEVVGALTADSLDPEAFDSLDPRLLETLGALAGAALQTSSLIETLEWRVQTKTRVARDLQRTAGESSGTLILGNSPAIARLHDEITLVAASDLPVLITGETGVGKELVARRLHDASKRREEALIHLNCAALPESVAESELFGHAAGAFTGAVKERAGKFETADGGSLFLDEVGELPLVLQPKLLRALQQGEVQRVGSDRLHRVDVRIIAATNRDLPLEVERGTFRADLYHRLAVYPIRVPPLRERREDITILALHFADAARRRLGLGPLELTQEAQTRLSESDWPGNVRELENVVSRAILRAAARRRSSGVLLVGLEHMDVTLSAPGLALAAPPRMRQQAPLREQVDAFQRKLIEEAVANNGGNWAAAARDLKMHRANLHHLAGRLGIKG